MRREPAPEIKVRPPLRTKLAAGFFSSLYGHPIRDMRLIVVAGLSGTVETANFIHRILVAAGQHAACLATEGDVTLPQYHGFLNKAWKTGANYVVVTASVGSLKKDLFFKTPVTAAVVVSTRADGLTQPDEETIKNVLTTLKSYDPELFVYDPDDPVSTDGLHGRIVTFGRDHFADVHILDEKSYRLGSEAGLSVNGVRLTVASFLTKKNAARCMAAAAAVCDALHIYSDAVVEGISNYDPEGVTGRAA